MAQEEAAAAVSAVSVKLPPFWVSDPQVWFAQVEAQFATRGITVQKTRFDFIVASLSPEIATEVRDLILAPPAERPYDVLKEQLTKRTAASEQKRLQLLLNAEELGDRKPTQLLRRMHQLLGEKAGSIDESLLRELFLQRLPANVRMVLASTSDAVTLSDLAQLADKITEVAAPSISAVGTPQLATEVEQLRTEIASLKKMVQSLASRSRRPSRSRSPSPNESHLQSDLCWYHQRFGDKATKCRAPCSKAGNELASH